MFIRDGTAAGKHECLNVSAHPRDRLITSFLCISPGSRVGPFFPAGLPARRTLHRFVANLSRSSSASVLFFQNRMCCKDG
ncbi:hypothetical protein CEXT_562141 [Caerostris extrusa]|uniref:Uncharacterized protein n=1 Tax=Caerostris extrusa TaxID=172846 RepID=A0AAV4TNC3_CAEEX|nr:hypothetical protein CEXT_562141 [Caerostris extrusa]